MASALSASRQGVWGQSPQWGPRANPLVGGQEAGDLCTSYKQNLTKTAINSDGYVAKENSKVESAIANPTTEISIMKSIVEKNST